MIQAQVGVLAGIADMPQSRRPELLPWNGRSSIGKRRRKLV
jgi:hypothetical protein